MSIAFWLRKLFGLRTDGQRPIVRPTSSRRHPLLEALECRLAPAVLTVNTTDTIDQRDDFLSLTESLRVINGTIPLADLTDAEEGQITGGAPGTNDTVELSAATYTLTTIDNYWYAPNGLGFIASRVTIEGNGAVIERAATAPAFRFFYVSGGLPGQLPAGDLTLRNLVLQGGLAQGGNGGANLGGGGAGMGGAIFNQGALTIEGATLVNNSAVGGGPGGNTVNGHVAIGPGGGGGGMGSDGSGAFFDGGGGGGFGGSLGGSYGGRGGDNPGADENIGGSGGGGFVTGADGGTGGVFTPGAGGGLGGFGGAGGDGSHQGGAGGDGGGGAGPNNAGTWGRLGGNFGEGGPGGQLRIDGGGGGGGVGGGGGGGLSFNGGGGGFGGGGGGSQNGYGADGGFGGGGGGSSTQGGGRGGFGGGAGFHFLAGGGAGMGGALFNFGGTIQIINSTLTANRAQGGGINTSGGSGLGGAVFNLNGNVTTLNSTLAANRVEGPVGGDGGAIYNLAFGNDIVTGAPVTATLTLTNSILAGSIFQIGSIGGADVTSTTVNGAGANLASSSGAHNVTGQDPQLAPLGYHGGLTPTMPLRAGSPAYNAGDNAAAPATDQRGENRPQHGTVDIGAFEVNSLPTAHAGGPYRVTEGGTLTLDASGSTYFNEDPLTFSWDVNGDGTFGDATGINPTLSWAELQALDINDGPFTIDDVRVQVSAGVQAPITSAATTLTVDNAPPTVTVNGAATALAGRTYTLTLAVVEPGDDTISAGVIRWGDGQATPFAGDGDYTHVYAEGAAAGLPYDITIELTDEDGTFTAGSLSVSVLLPAHAGGPYRVTEGASLTLDGSASALAGDLSWDVNGDGRFGDATGINPTLSWAQLQALGIIDGPFSIDNVRVQVSDGVQAPVTSAATTLTVDNAPPTITVNGAATVAEGSTYTLTLGAMVDPGDDTMTGAIVRWGDGQTTPFAGAGDYTHVYADGAAAGTPYTIATIAVEAIDEDGTFTAGSLSLTVTNVAPTATLSNNGPAGPGAPVQTTFSGVNDPGIVDGASFSFALDPADLPARYVDTFTDPGADQAPGLTHWWRGEGDFTDSIIIGGLTGTPQTAPAFTVGRFGQAFQANFTVADEPTLNDNSATWSLWMNLSGGVGGQALLGKGSRSGGLNVSLANLSPDSTMGQLDVLWIRNFALSTPSLPVNDGAWHHVALTFESGREVCLYFDGVLVGRTTAVPFAFGNDPLRIGVPDLSRDSSFTGALDEVALYDRVLSAAEVRASMGQAPASRTWTFADPGEHIVHGRVFDQDGGFNDYQTTVKIDDGIPDHFDTSLWADFGTNDGWTSQLVGDFNNDGRDDVANFHPSNGTWWVSLALPAGGFATTLWADYATNSGWTSQLVGDFNADGYDDIANFHPSNGTWWLSLSNFGNGGDLHFQPVQLWADYSTNSGWTSQLVGDFNRDGYDDIANFHPSNGTWWVSLSGGANFTTTLWADYATNSGWTSQLVGDFNRDGYHDIANFHPSNGTWWVSLSNGTTTPATATAFTTTLWADFATNSGWKTQVVGDFNDDGRDDIANFHPGNGTWWVSLSGGANFATTLWADYATNTGWTTQIVGDYNGDGDDDIANFHPGNGTWWVSASNETTFTTTLWADYATNSGWTAQVVGNFNGDAFDDIASFHPSNGTWWVSLATSPAPLTLNVAATAPAADVASLTQAQLDRTVARAFSIFANLGVNTSQFGGLSFAIADLSGSILGLADTNVVTIDINAAGHGWSLGDTLDADDVDLLSVVLHELGHELDLEHGDADFMAALIGLGERRLPRAEEIDAILQAAS